MLFNSTIDKETVIYSYNVRILCIWENECLIATHYSMNGSLKLLGKNTSCRRLYICICPFMLKSKPQNNIPFRDTCLYILFIYMVNCKKNKRVI